MVKIADIVDRESLEAWLEGQPRESAVIVAHRAAMRDLPLSFDMVMRTEAPKFEEYIVLQSLWLSLISWVGAFCTSLKFEMQQDALAAAAACVAADPFIELGSEYNSVLANYAAETAAETATYAAKAAVSSAFQVKTFADNEASNAEATLAFWKNMRADCELLNAGGKLASAPLWPKGQDPLAEIWQWVKAGMAQDEVDWSFWTKWYEAALSGSPLPCALLLRIALEVKEEDWKQGPAHVNGLIAGIEAAFVAGALPQADKMDIDPETGLVETTPIVTTAEKIVLTSLKQVEFSYSVAKSGNCGLNFGSVASLYLEQTFEACRDDANAILQNYQVALDDIRMGLENGAYQSDAKLSALVVVLEKEIVNLLANHPEVKKADRARIAHHLSLAKADVKLQIVEELEFAKAAAGVRLEAEMSLDGKLLAQEGESPAQTRAAQRLFGRIAQMYVTLKNASAAAVKKIDAASGYKFARIVATLGKIVGWITGLFP